MPEIVDFSWGRPGAAALKAAGVKAVIRYLTRDTTGKGLSVIEAEEYREAGLSIIGVFQDSASRARGGVEAGRADGKFALDRARAFGLGIVGAIYFAVDFDVRPADLGAIEAYFRGVNEYVPLANVGIYGDYDSMQRIFEKDLATYYWQAGARSWSGNRQFPHADMLQLVEQPLINNVPVDVNQRLTHSIGEWRVSDSMAEETGITRDAVEKELNEATAVGFQDFDQMFNDPKGGIVALLRALYNGIGLNRGIQVTDQVGLVGLSTSQVGADVIRLHTDMVERLRRIEGQLDRVIAGLGAVTSGPTTPSGEVDLEALADLIVDRLGERLMDASQRRPFLAPRRGTAARFGPSATPSGVVTGGLEPIPDNLTAPLSGIEVRRFDVDPMNPLGLGGGPEGDGGT